SRSGFNFPFATYFESRARSDRAVLRADSDASGCSGEGGGAERAGAGNGRVSGSSRDGRTRSGQLGRYRKRTGRHESAHRTARSGTKEPLGDNQRVPCASSAGKSGVVVGGRAG